MDDVRMIDAFDDVDLFGNYLFLLGIQSFEPNHFDSKPVIVALFFCLIHLWGGTLADSFNQPIFSHSFELLCHLRM